MSVEFRQYEVNIFKEQKFFVKVTTIAGDLKNKMETIKILKRKFSKREGYKLNVITTTTITAITESADEFLRSLPDPHAGMNE